MNKHTEHDAREHLGDGRATLPATWIHRDGAKRITKTAEVPKGSFYHYFRSKEAFGVAMLERHYAAYHQRLTELLQSGEGNYRDRILAYYQQTLNQFCQHGTISGCLTVKLSAEVCDLSEDMRSAMDKGARGVIALLSQALENGRENHCLTFCGEPLQQAQVLLRTVAWRESAGQNFAQFRATGKRAGPCKKHYCDACRLAGIFYHQTTGSLYVI